MIGSIFIFLAGGVTALLVARVNPWVRSFVYKVADKVEDTVEEKTGIDL